MLLLSALSLLAPLQDPSADGPFLRTGDTIALIGNALAERMQHHGWFETYLHACAPEARLSVRNLGFAADELTVRQRTAGFGEPDEHLTRVGADVVLLFFGFVESFVGEEGLEAFESNLALELEHLAQARYGDERPRIALVAPIPYEYLPPTASFTLEEGNARIGRYRDTLVQTARERGLLHLDAWTAMQMAYAESDEPLTIDGVHLNERGNRALGRFLAGELTEKRGFELPENLGLVRDTVLGKNLLWFNRYRATDGYNVYGGRSSLKYNDQTNYEVLQRELEILDVLCANSDREIHSLANGEGRSRTENALPVPDHIPVPTNRPGAAPDGAHPYLSGLAAIERMTLPEGLRAELFADEERFPEIANPVQMAFDARGRLWVAAWPTYPHWKPGEEMDDRLVILEDVDGDGRADESTLFARGLHNPTGFEFWNGGVYLATAPDLLFLEDTDGDDQVDRIERVLGALSSADTHHAANSFVIDPGGALYFQEGTFHQSQIETAHGAVRNRNGCVWRFDPRTWRVERYVAYNFANPHGHVFDRWGQDFVTDGTGNVNYYALPFSGHLPEPLKHRTYFSFFAQRSRPAGATEILSSAHFPDEYQGNYLIANVIGFQGIFRYAVQDEGSGFGASELEPLVQSSDPNFRPVDLEVGPDGAVYLLDWQTPLIGHMQHHLRDPSRDHEHGRVYRIRAADRPLLVPEAVAGRRTDELVALLRHDQDRLRQRVRAELSSRSSDEVVAAASRQVSNLGAEADEHELLELLWLKQQHGSVDRDLLGRLLAAERSEARAAATRVVRQQRYQLPDALDLLAKRIVDEHPRVRLEALVALSHLRDAGERATALALRVLQHPRDRFLDYALEETLRALESAWRPALVTRAGFLEDDAVGLGMLLDRLDPNELMQVLDSATLFDAILRRPGLPTMHYARAVDGLAARRGVARDESLLGAIEEADNGSGPHVDHMLIELFGLLRSVELSPETANRVEELRQAGLRRTTRRLAIAALLENRFHDPKKLLAEADESPGALLDFLEGACRADPAAFEGGSSDELVPLLLRWLDAPRKQGVDAAVGGRYVRIELPGESRTLTLAEVQVMHDGVNIAPTGTASQSTTNWGGVAKRALDGNTSSRWGDGAQTHTIENRPNPWWELDLGREHPIDEIVVWNRVEEGGDLWRRLEGFQLSLLDAHRRTNFELAQVPAPRNSVTLQVGHPDALVRRAAARTLAHVQGLEAAPLLVARSADPNLRPAALEGLRRLGVGELADPEAEELTRTLLGQLATAADSAPPPDRVLLAFAQELADSRSGELAEELARAVRRAGPQILVVRPLPESLLFDRKLLVAIAGRPVELVFENTDLMPHNLVVTAVGALVRVGLAAEAMALAADAWDKSYVPDLDEVLWATQLLQPGEAQTLSFDAPEKPGDYPFVCTFPGHWARMNGILKIVATEEERDVIERRSSVTEAATPVSTGRPFVRSWKLADLRGDIVKGAVGQASAAQGSATFAAASCTRCHRVGGEGGLTGPPLEEAVAKYPTAVELLSHVLEPSQSIDAAYTTEILELEDGTFTVGRVVEEEEDFLLVQDDPYDSETLLEVERGEVAYRTVSQVSAMPIGLLNTFTKQEILDLLAFLEGLRAEPAGEGR